MMRRASLAVLTATVGFLGLATGAQAEVRVAPNYRMNADTSPFRGHDRVGLAVNPANPQHVVEFHADYLQLRCEGTTSSDGGATWSADAPLPLPAPTAMQEPFLPSCGSNQSIEFGTGQNVYATATAQRSGPNFPQDSSVLVWRSTDGGLTWQPGVVAMAGGPGGAPTSPGPSYNRPTVSVHRGAGAGGADRIYLAAHETQGAGKPCGSSCLPVRSAVSNDGGQTFSAPVDVTPQSTHAIEPSEPVVNSDGSVTVAWRTIGSTGLLQASRSADGGQTWSAPVDIATVTNTGTSTQSHVPTAPGVTPQSSTTASYPRMAADPTRPGTLYLVYNQGHTGPTAPPGGFQGADHFISPDSAVWFQRSRDRGATWSQPKLISDRTPYPGSQLVQTRHPNISVSPSGRINIVWHDRRHWYQEPGERTCSHSHIFCEDVRLGDTYLSHSTNGGDTFSPNIRVSDRSMNDDVGYDTRPSGYWNYSPQAVTVAEGRLLVGWMDSREGNWDTDTQDIYFGKVNFDATGPAPQANISAPDAIARAIALSRVAYQGGNQGALIGGPRDPAGSGSFGPASRNATGVVIVNDTDAAGALAGAVLARANPGPVLLSPAAGLPDSVKAEVSRLAPARAFVIGDTGKLSAQVVADLEAAGIPAAQITRLSGPNDAATAAAVAARLDQRFPAETSAGTPAFDAAVIVNPAGPDAAAVAGLAAARRLPVLFAGSSVPAETAAAIDSLDINKTLVVGGPAQVSDPAMATLPAPTRLGGADQYATSASVVAESKARGLPGNVVWVADGAVPMDGALLGAAVARTTGIMLLAKAPVVDTAAGAAAAANLAAADQLVVLGTPRQTPTPSPTPTATATATPTATPPYGIPDDRKRPGLTATVKPKRDRRKPFRYTTTGRLTLPSGVSRAAGCRGKVAIKIKPNRSAKTISSRLATVRRNCTFSRRVTFKNSKRFGKGKLRRRGTLKFTIRFQGNARLTPRTIRRTARYG